MTLQPSMHVTTSGEGFTAKKVALKLAETEFRSFVLNLKEAMPLDRLMAPKFWATCKDLVAGDLIRIKMPNPNGGRGFDFMLTVVEHVGAGGPVMGLWPYAPLPQAAPQIAHG